MGVIIPKTVDELLPEIDNANKRLICGGTDVKVLVNSLKIKSMPLININRIDEIKRIFKKDSEIYIGSNVTLSEILENNMIKNELPLLIKGIKTIGSPQIRNIASLGGNIGNASPSGDGLLVSCALDATLLLKSKRGERRIKLVNFILGPSKTSLLEDEFIEYIVFNNSYNNYRPYYEKVGLRNAMIISIASMSMLVKTRNRIIEDIILYFGAVAKAACRAEKCEKFLINKEINYENIEKASYLILEDIKPISDLRASEGYRKALSRNLLFRLISMEDFK